MQMTSKLALFGTILTLSTLTISNDTIISFGGVNGSQSEWSYVLGKHMSIANGHYRKCLDDRNCSMSKYREWHTYITSNDLPLNYEVDTFEFTESQIPLVLPEGFTVVIN